MARTSALHKFLIFFSFSFFFIASFLQARDRAPLPQDAFDGDIFSAETLGRGGTIASMRGSPASGSENPASLASDFPNSFYTTVLFAPSSSLPDEVVDAHDPLASKTLRYISAGTDKGVIFYEPLGRRRERQIIDPSNPGTDFRDVEFSANAIGFAGTDKFGKSGGQVGISLAYLYSSLTSDEHSSIQPNHVVSDTAEGLRMNLGMKIPTGPMMWGLVVQNAPAFLWGKDYKRQMLPVRVRAGNTWRLTNGYLLSVEGERRYYREGGNPQDYVYIGNESYITKNFAVRIGAFGQHIGKPDDRHVTAGASFLTKKNSNLSYAYEVFRIDEEKVRRSLLSVEVPFSAGGGNEN